MNEGLPHGHLPYHFLLRKAGKPSVIANSHCWAPQHSLGWLLGKVTRAWPRMVLSQRCHCQLQHSPCALPTCAWHGETGVTHQLLGAVLHTQQQAVDHQRVPVTAWVTAWSSGVVSRH